MDAPLWSATDRTGGPVDEVFDRLRREIPELIVQRLEIPHPADDDNVYFLWGESAEDSVQLDTGPGGRPPFIIESEQRAETSDVAEVVATIAAWLKAMQ